MKLCICCKYFHQLAPSTEGDPPKGRCERLLSETWTSYVDGESYYQKCYDDAQTQRSRTVGDACGPDAKYYQTAMVTTTMENGDKFSFDPRAKFGG